ARTDGAFVFESVAAGTYTLEVSASGYRAQSIALTLSNGAEKQLDAIVLAADAKELNTVVVSAQQQKALVEDKGDRLVYNAAADISNSGGTATDVLRKVPGLSVDLDGNVQLRGNGNIKVLVNGKPSAIMARNLADALKQMPANVIKTVEVITSPGAKYDAEGAAGVINIITKRGLRGFNGTVNVTAGDRSRSVGGNLSLKRKQIGLNFSGNVSQYRNTSERFARTTFDSPRLIVENKTTSDNTGTSAYGELAVDYDPDSLNHLNLSVNIWGGDFPNNSTTYSHTSNGAGIVVDDFRNESRFRNPYGNGQMDLGWTRSFRKEGQEVSLAGQFSRMPDNYFYSTDRMVGDKATRRERSDNYSRNKEYTIQADYTHPFSIKGRRDTSVLRLEVGTKAILRDIGSEVRVQVSGNGDDPLLADPSQDNDFGYKQHVYSGYTSLRWNNKQRWNTSLGARFEQTEINGDFITSGTHIDSRYNNFIPSAMISKGFGKHTLKVSYTQRITRPLIWYLNPWINRSNPKQQATGNPELNPELSHATELSYSLVTPKGISFNSALYWRQTDNALEYVTEKLSGDTTISRPRNIAKRGTVGLNVNVSGKPNKNWSVNVGGDLRHQAISSIALNQSNEGFTWNANTNTSYKLPKGNYTFQGYAGVFSGWIGLQNTSTTIGYWYGLSAKKSFWQEKGSVTLSANTPFNSGNRQRNMGNGPGYTSEMGNYWVSRSFRVTFEWRFGQMSADGGKQGKKIANDDSGR
ncbi:MAG: TonB-dependent receptor, partial [Sphingobacteriales bacterium]